jgi:hypothetical protein
VKRDDLVRGFVIGALFGLVLMWWLLSPGFAPVRV